MSKNLFLIFGVLVYLAGCSTIPKYTPPTAAIPSDWPSGPAYQKIASSENIPVNADLHWQKFFTDTRLQTIIDTALKNNRDLRIAALNVEKARTLYHIQRDEYLPTVEAVGGNTRKHSPADISNSGRANTTNQYSVNFGITSWEIDFFGHLHALETGALEEYFSTEQARRAAHILLISEIANAYLTLAADRERLHLARSTLEAQQASYHVIRRRFEVGLTPELDIYQAQTRVEGARVDIARFTELIAQDENALNLLVGLSVSADSDLLPKGLSAITPFPDVSPGTSSEILLSRPDILQAENLLKAANANIIAARTALFPRILLTTVLGTASGELSGLFQSGSLAWNYATQISMPIFDARAWSALETTKIEREIALTKYERTIQGAFRNVADALAQRGTIEDQLKSQKSLVDAAEGVYRIANARYTKGIDTYLSVLDAQRSLYAAQQQFIAIRLAQFVNQARLYAVLGGGGD